MEGKNEEVVDQLNCVVCLEVAIGAMECDQCNNLLCSTCTMTLKKKDCPICRKTGANFKPSVLARRMIDSFPCVCPNECEEKDLKIGSLKSHLEKCEKRMCQCNIKNCDFKGYKDDFLQHLLNSHPKELCQ